ncbi:MAG TPA: hypothetical protein VFV87_17325, partial [Pirellulaceae bacterium]|nr:hypothetical protein [Pirellulaceae bacterium]
MQRFSSEPLQAVILPDPPPQPPPSGAWKTWCLAIGAFGLFIVCSGAAFWGLGKLVNFGVDASPKGSLVYSWETPEEHRVNVTAAMNVKTTGCTAAELRELNRFFTRVIDALAASDKDEFRELVDLSAFAHRASLHPAAVAAGGLDRGQLKDQLEYDLEGPSGWSRFSIIRVEHGKIPDEALVYVVFESDEQQPAPYRWWLRRSARVWNICDWELIDLGYSETARWALVRAIEDDPDNGSYWQAAAAIERSHDKAAAGQRGAAQAELRDAQTKRLPAAIHDMTQIELAIAWDYAGRPDLALTACDRVKNASSEIGVAYLRAHSQVALDVPDKALTALAEYRQMAGCHPELLALEADALGAQGKRANAAECWWEVLRLMPENHEALFDFCRLADDSRRKAIKEILARSRRPTDRALEIGIAAIQRDEYAAAEAILDYLRQTAPGSAAIEQLTAQQLDDDEQYVAAAEHYLAAFKLESDPDNKRQLLREYLGSMALGGKAVEGYLAADDKAEAFDLLTDGYEYDEAYVRDDQLSALIAEHRQHVAEDATARLDFLEGRRLLNQGDFDAAEQAFLKIETSDVEPDLVEAIRSGRLEALYRQGKLKEAYEADDQATAETFRELAWLAVGDDNWDALGKLLELHLTSNSGDPWLDYFTTRREQAYRNYTTALAAAVRGEASADEQLKPLLMRLKTELFVQSDNISQAYASGGPPQEAFLRIAGQLTDQGDWNRLLQAAELHSAAAPGEIAGLYYATKARWNLGRHQQLVQNLTPWPKERLQNADQAWNVEIADLLVRGWLRLGNIEEARKAAEQARDDLGLELPLVAVELAAGDREKVKTLLANPLIGRELFQRQLQHDSDFAALLSDSEFAEIRRRYAHQRPNEYGQRNASIVLLLRKPAEESRVKEDFEHEVASAMGGPVRSLGQSAGETHRQSLIADLPAGTLAFTYASRPYSTSAGL